MTETRKTKPSSERIMGEVSVWVVLTSALAVLASVWLIVKLSFVPEEAKGLPEEAILTDFILVPRTGGPWLGLNIATSEKAFQNGGKRTGGVLVTRVMLGSPAERAGMRVGDVIVRVENQSIDVPADLMNAVESRKMGDKIRLTVNRGGRQQKLFLILGAQPMGTLAAAQGKSSPAWLGADVQNIDAVLASQLGLPNERGVVVSNVYPDSPAATAGLVQGNVIRRVGETRVRDMAQLQTLIAAYRPGDIVQLLVWQSGAQKQLTLKLGSMAPLKKLPKPTLPEAEVETEAAWLGLDIVPLTPAEAEELGLAQNLQGVVVDAVAPGTGTDAGFLVGDVIVAVNGKPTASINEFQEATEGAVGALVDVIRLGGRHVYVSVPAPGSRSTPGGQAVRRVGWTLW